MQRERRYLHLEGKVEDVMTRDPVVVHENDGLDRLIHMFKAHNFHGFPVVDEEGRLVGIVRDTDVLSIFARRDPAFFAYEKVKDIMLSPPLVIDGMETVQKAIMRMFADQTRLLVVVDQHRKIRGVVTRFDLIKGVHLEDPPPEGTPGGDAGSVGGREGLEGG